MKFGVVVFPGSNCDKDCFHVIENVLGQAVRYIWHDDTDLGDTDCIVLPGGFSYGDYLRSGAIARFSPVIKSVKDFASKGGLVIGICNGFQILLESGLLPGAMLPNLTTHFICRHVDVKIENSDTIFTSEYEKGQVLNIPIAHNEGNYYVTGQELEELRKNNQIVLRYSDKEGNINQSTNPNGSKDNIAGIINKNGNVLGMMPHPERCSELILGSQDGKGFFESIINSRKGQKI